MPRLLAAIWLVMTFMGISAKAQNPYQIPTLKGINTIFVDVEDLSESAKTLNLTKEAIQTDVELKLRLAGMRVVTLEQGVKLPGSPYLYINVIVSENSKAASISVDLVQDAILVRDGQFATGVTTWNTGALITNPADAQDIRNAIKDYVDKFLNDWLSVNPKK
jgi:hypothetical protein